MKMSYRLDRQSKPFPRDISPLLREVKDYMVSSTQRKIASGIGPANAPITQAVKQNGLTLRDRGGLITSIAGKSDRTSASVGTSKKQARILHYGGTIRPKRAKHLTIPAGPRTRRLMRQFGTSPRACIDGMKSSGFVVWKQGKVLMARKGKRGNPFVLFVLKTSVKIPARPFLTIEALDRQVILDKTRRFIR